MIGEKLNEECEGESKNIIANEEVMSAVNQKIPK